MRPHAGQPAVTPALPRCSSRAGWGRARARAPPRRRGWGVGLAPQGPGYRAKRRRGIRAGSPRRTSPDGWGPSRCCRVRPGGGAPAFPPAAGPHVVDDHGLVGDDVVGLHGGAGSALPSRQAAGRTSGPAGGLTGPLRLQTGRRAPPT